MCFLIRLFGDELNPQMILFWSHFHHFHEILKEPSADGAMPGRWDMAARCRSARGGDAERSCQLRSGFRELRDVI